MRDVVKFNNLDSDNVYAMAINKDRIETQLSSKKEVFNTLLTHNNELQESFSRHQKDLALLKTQLSNSSKKKVTHLVSLLRDGRDTRDYGLSWIVMALWEIGQGVNLRDFPKVLDEGSRTFIIEKAKLESSIAFIQ